MFDDIELNVENLNDSLYFDDKENSESIVIEISGLKTINSFIGLEDTPLYYDNNKFFKIVDNKVVYTDIQWKDITGDLKDQPELIELIKENVSEASEEIISYNIGIHNTDPTSHKNIRDTIDENFSLLNNKINNTNINLENTQLDITNKYNELLEDIDTLDEKVDNTKNELQSNINNLSEIVQQHYTDLTQDINDLVDTVDDNKESAEKGISDLNKRIDDSNKDIDDINTNLAQEIENREFSENQINATIQSNYTTLNNKIEDVDNRLTEVAEEINQSIEDNVAILQNKDVDLQTQIDAIVSSSDVKDIVGTYQQLQNYDKTKLGNNDIIKVLQDETKNNALTYYRFISDSNNFSYIGSEGPYYTKGEADDTFVPQARTINGKALNTNVTLIYSDVNALSENTTISDLTTQSQQDAINSGITSSKLNNLEENKADKSELPTKLSELTDDLGSNPVHTHSQYLIEQDLQTYGSELDYTDDTLSLLNNAGNVLSSVTITSREPEQATEEKAGIIQISTNEEALQGIIDTKTITPKKLKNVLDNKDKDLDKYNLTKLEDYLYTISYTNKQIDYNYALEYFLNNYHDFSLGACTSVRKGNIFGRNYDWYYSESVSFVIKKEASNTRYASIGMSGGLTQLTKNFVETKEWNDIYKILPYFLLDGINEHGLTISMNVVPINQKGKTTGTHQDKTGDNICMLMLPSYILDNFKTANEAISWILNDAKIYAPYNQNNKEELHFLIADKYNTYVVEFIDNQAVVIEDKNYITNFYLNSATFDENNKVNFNSVTPYGQGLERYNLIAENYENINSSTSMLELMTSLNYTKAYDIENLENWWKTEFVSPYADEGYQFPNLTVTTPIEIFTESGFVAFIEDRFEKRTRDGETTWQTIHTSIYDIDKKQFTLLVQEQNIDKLKTFQLFNNIGDGKLTIKQDNINIGTYTANQSIDTEINIDLSNKQNVIDDLEDIRSKSNDGAIAKNLVEAHIDNTLIHVTENDKTNWNNKQEFIEDLEDIRINAKTGADLAPQVQSNTEKIENIVVSRFPNVVIVGTPHIEGGQVSNYSSTNYLQFPFVDISRGFPFDIYFSFTTSNDIITQQNIIDSYFGIAIAIKDGKGLMAISTNGEAWESDNIIGTNTLLPNTTYYAKFSWNGIEYSTALSTNEEIYVPDMLYQNSSSPYKTTIFIGGSPDIFGPNTSHPFKGTINFNKAYVKVNDTVIWKGMEDVGLATRANVSLSNLDNVGEARFEAKQDVIDDLEQIRENASVARSTVNTHITNTVIHVTNNDKINWNNKVDNFDIDLIEGAEQWL